MTNDQLRAIKVAMDKRILNEFGSKILNEERLEKAFKSRKADDLAPHANMSFECECDDSGCDETIIMSTEEYQRVHLKTRNFIVVPTHVHLDLEEIIAAFNSYVLVGKFFPHPASS